jgi:2-polyprenyl-3-methyl-5-hydroxy-6-metoxy-1,4-benzoquinol methylase
MTNSNHDNHSKNVETFFHGYAKDFSSIYEEDEHPRSKFNILMDKLFRQDIKDRFDSTIKEVQKDSIQSILDIGCGPGHFVVKFLEMGKKVTALDIAPGMLDITNSRISSFDIEGQYESILADYTEHKFDEKFDAICVMGFFDYVSDPTAVLKKLLLEASKEIYISFPDDHGLLAWQRKIRYKRRNCPLYLYNESKIKMHLEEAGCLEIAEINKTNRNFFVTIRK